MAPLPLPLALSLSSIPSLSRTSFSAATTADLDSITASPTMTEGINAVFSAMRFEDEDEIITGPPMTGVWIVIAVFVLLGMLFTVIAGWIWCVSAMEPGFYSGPGRGVKRVSQWRPRRRAFREWYRHRRHTLLTASSSPHHRPPPYHHPSHHPYSPNAYKPKRRDRQHIFSSPRDMLLLPNSKRRDYNYGSLDYSSSSSPEDYSSKSKIWSGLEKELPPPMSQPERGRVRAPPYFDRRRSLNWGRGRGGRGVGLLAVVVEESGTPPEK
ncbi:hypothetical protein RUND412_008677 [Rhizina undulata]